MLDKTLTAREGAESGAPDFRLLFESLPGLVLILLPDAPRFTLVAVSDSYLAATLTQRSILGRGLFEVFPDNPNDPAADGVRNLHASLMRALHSRQADRMALQKYDVERPDGSGFEEKWWSPLNTPVLADGAVRYIIHQVSDVTAEVQLKRESTQQVQALAESEARYRRLADNLPVVIFRCWDAPGWPMTYMNQAAEAVTGYPASTFVEHGRLFGTLILEEDLPGLVRAVERQMAEGNVFQSEYRIRHADGRVRWIMVNSRRQPDADGRLYYEGTLTDVSDSKHAERELAARADALERARIATAAAKVAPYTWYIARDQLETDALGETLHGLAPGRFKGTLKSLLWRVHPDDRAALAKSFADAAAAASISEFQLEYRTVSEQGRVRWLRSVGTVSVDENGRRSVGAVIDVTLEVEVQKVLEQRSRELERANTELDDFTYVASHDLKEPLRGIHNYARFLAEDYGDKLDAGGQQMLTALSQQAGRMQRLIDDLLAIARLGREPMRRRECQLDPVLDEVLASLSFSLTEKKVALRREPLGQASCDPVRVSEVLRNLITNALKYNDKPAPLVEIGRRPGPLGIDEFYVRDNGIGIKPEFHARVFAPFKRLHGKDAYGGGTGVGLAIVKRIVEAHDGHIQLDSAPGIGTTFAFTLSAESHD